MMFTQGKIKIWLSVLMAFLTIIPWYMFNVHVALAATSIRQEVNITDAYYYAAANTYATSSEIVAITDSNYSSPTYYFEAVASTTAGTNATVKLVNATSSATVATLTINGGNTYARYRSTTFTPTSSSTVEYKVVLGNENIGKGIIASRIVILQSPATLSNTETQIEIGSATTTASNTTTLPLQNPKYWYYDSSKWDASPTFYVEATYIVNPVASSTTYNASATTTATFFTYIASAGVGYIVGEAWGGGGGGDGVSSASTIGGGGGGGGTYARATTTVNPGSTNYIGVGRGGAEGTAKADSASSTLRTASGLVLAAEGGEGATSGTGAATSSLSSSVGGIIYAGGKGGGGETTVDTGGGGGGSAGPDGYGISGGNAVANGPGGTGGKGDLNLGGAGGAGGNGGDDTCDTENGGHGVNNVLGGGGGGGADGDVSSICLGGNGGRPGGGGGGSDEGANTSQLGGPGQVKITEYIGTVGIALQESDGTGDGFQNFAYKAMVVIAGPTSTTSERVRSAAFTPTSGRNYRIVASTTNATAPYSIYNAKIVINNPVPNPIDSSGMGSDFITGTSINEGIITTINNDWLFDAVEENDSSGLTVNVAQTLVSPSITCGVGSMGSSYKSVSTAGTQTMNWTAGTSGALVGSTTISIRPINGFTISKDATSTSGCKSGSTSYNFTHVTASGADVLLVSTIGNSGGIGVSNVSYNGKNLTRVPSTVSGLAPAYWYLQSPSVGSNTITVTVGSGVDSYSFAGITLNNADPVIVTLLEPQYLLANTKLANNTSLQNFLTSWDSTEWSTTNAYYFEADAADNSTSVVELDTSGGTQVTNSAVSSPDNRGRSSAMCMPSTGDLDVKATTNNNDVYGGRIIVQVGGTPATCGGGGVTVSATLFKEKGQTLIIKGGTLKIKG